MIGKLLMCLLPIVEASVGKCWVTVLTELNQVVHYRMLTVKAEYLFLSSTHCEPGILRNQIGKNFRPFLVSCCKVSLVGL